MFPLTTQGTTKRVYRANDIRAKLDETADTWIGACFFAKNVMKFLRGLLCLIFEICGFKTLTEPIFNDEAYLIRTHLYHDFLMVVDINATLRRPADETATVEGVPRIVGRLCIRG